MNISKKRTLLRKKVRHGLDSNNQLDENIKDYRDVHQL